MIETIGTVGAVWLTICFAFAGCQRAWPYLVIFGIWMAGNVALRMVSS